MFQHWRSCYISVFTRQQSKHREPEGFLQHFPRSLEMRKKLNQIFFCFRAQIRLKSDLQSHLKMQMMSALLFVGANPGGMEKKSSLFTTRGFY